MIANPEKGGLEQTCSLWQEGRSTPGVREPGWLASSFSPWRKTFCVDPPGLAVRSFLPSRECLLLHLSPQGREKRSEAPADAERPAAAPLPWGADPEARPPEGPKGPTSSCGSGGGCGAVRTLHLSAAMQCGSGNGCLEGSTPRIGGAA